jgi:hypothetical protein
MLGAAAAPALAAGKGHAKGKATAPGQTKQKPAKPADKKPDKKAKPAKKSHFGVSGGGTVAGGSFSIQARLRKPSNGHFNYTSTDGKFKVRCKDGWDAPTAEPVLSAYPRTMDVTFKSCQITGQATKTNLVVTVTDNGQPTKTKDGQPAAAAVAKDAMRFGVAGPAAADGNPTTTTWGGDLVDGNVKIRNK